MDPRTLEALKGSIKKWEGIVEGAVEDEGPNNCPLCHIFNVEGGGDCAGCPVYEKSGQSKCYDTPYEKYADTKFLLQNSENDFIVEPNEGPLKALAQAELDFLKSLLPEEEETKDAENPT